MKADLVVKNGSIVTPEATLQGGVAVAGGKIVAIGANDTLPEGKQKSTRPDSTSSQG